MQHGIRLAPILTLLMLLHGAAPAFALGGEAAVAKVKLADGTDAGTISLSETNAGILIKFDLRGLSPGPHAIHVHETGKCEGDFASAGAIHNPLGAGHGYLNAEGPMNGDLPNIHAGADGKAQGEILSQLINLSRESEDSIFDTDGASFVLFEKPDDYLTDPEGEAGARIACGVIDPK